MTLSQAALQSALAQSTAENWLECLTFDHPDLPAPIRLVNDNVDLIRAAGTFLRFPFSVSGATQNEEAPATASITLDAVDQRIVKIVIEAALVSSRNGPVTVTIEVVLKSDPDTVIEGPLVTELLSANGGGATLTLNLSAMPDSLIRGFPGRLFSPSNSKPI